MYLSQRFSWGSLCCLLAPLPEVDPLRSPSGDAIQDAAAAAQSSMDDGAPTSRQTARTESASAPREGVAASAAVGRRLPGKRYFRRPRASFLTWVARPLQTLRGKKEGECVTFPSPEGREGSKKIRWALKYVDGSSEDGESRCAASCWDRPYEHASKKLGWAIQPAIAWWDGGGGGSVCKRDFPEPGETASQKAQRYAYAEETGLWGELVWLSLRPQ